MVVAPVLSSSRNAPERVWRSLVAVVALAVVAVLGGPSQAWATGSHTGDVHPVVTSRDVQPGEVAPAKVWTFVFRVPADAGVVGFEYQWSQFWSSGATAAERFTAGAVPAVGGRAVVRVVPRENAYHTLWVRGFDAAGHDTEATSSSFYAPFYRPGVTYVRGLPTPAGTTTVRFTPPPGAPRVVAYRYTLGRRGAEVDTVEVPTAGHVTQTVVRLPDTTEDVYLVVRAVSANGYVSLGTELRITLDRSVWVNSDVYRTNETAGGVGVPGAFTFVNRQPGATAVRWAFDEDPFTTTPLVGGRARTTWTPGPRDDAHTLTVFAVLPDGSLVNGRTLLYDVAAPVPARPATALTS